MGVPYLVHQLSVIFGLPRRAMADYVASLGMILVLMRQMETTVLRLRDLREYVTAEVSTESLDAAITKNEIRIADVKRKLAASDITLIPDARHLA